MSDTNMVAKTIQLLLYDGDKSGVMSIEDSSWNSGELYAAPRASVNNCLRQRPAIDSVFICCSHEIRFISAIF